MELAVTPTLLRSTLSKEEREDLHGALDHWLDSKGIRPESALFKIMCIGCTRRIVVNRTKVVFVNKRMEPVRGNIGMDDMAMAAVRCEGCLGLIQVTKISSIPSASERIEIPAVFDGVETIHRRRKFKVPKRSKTEPILSK